MLDYEIEKYFDGIEPDDELIERMVTMSEQSSNKKIKFSKKMIAIIAAAALLICATTATAAIIRVKNDDNSIVKIDENDAFSLEFSNAKRTPEKLSDTNNDAVKAISDMGIRDIVIPKMLIDSYKLDSINKFLPNYKSVMINFNDDNSEYVSMSIIQDISDEDIDGFWGTGDENSTGEVVNINGIDVVIVYMGDEELGYSSFIFYANGNTIYQITYSTGLDGSVARDKTLSLVETLAQ